MAVAACGTREAPPRAAAPADAAVAVAADAVVAPADAAGPTAPGSTVRIPDDTLQLVTAIVPGWDDPTAELAVWTRAGVGQPWQRARPPWPAVIGTSGAAWGRGLHGDGAPDRAGPVKREGDGRSPAGLFAIGPAFGYAAAPPRGATLPYTAVDDGWRCVDDPTSAHYNHVLDERTVQPDWSSAEAMRRRDALYTWVVEIRHNPGGERGAGSCIFFHVWRGAGHATVGCTAMREQDLVALLQTLDPAARPLFTLLPAADYAAVKDAWGLP